MKRVIITSICVLLMGLAVFFIVRHGDNDNNNSSGKSQTAEHNTELSSADNEEHVGNTNGDEDANIASSPVDELTSETISDREEGTESLIDEAVKIGISGDGNISEQENEVYGSQSETIREDNMTNSDRNSSYRNSTYHNLKDMIDEAEWSGEGQSEADGSDNKSQSEIYDSEPPERTEDDTKTKETKPAEDDHSSTDTEETEGPNIFELAQSDEKLTYDYYINDMSAEQKKELYDAAPSAEEYLKWLAKIRSEYDAERSKHITNAEEGISF